MPITQQRMIDLISAAEATYQSWLDLKASINASMDARAQGILSDDEFISQLYSAGYATAPATHHLILIAKERQHFHEWAKRNDYQANRRAAKRGAAATRHTEGAKSSPRPNRPGMINVISPEQIAKAQKPAFTFDPAAALSTIGTPPSPATPEQLAADDAMMADPDIEAEMAAHIAALRRGDQ